MRSLNGPYGKALTVKTYMSCSSSHRRSRALSPGSSVSVAADAPETRNERPYGASGDTRAFTAGAYVSRLCRISVQVSPGWTSVEYARWPTPSPRDIESAQLAVEFACFEALLDEREKAGGVGAVDEAVVVRQREMHHRADDDDPLAVRMPRDEDRKSTRLNSSHVAISYAVF